ncbi:alkaline phosphatase family protein, partial [bacterium]|nr:alkaline phosphatase family protein [bacterium]
IFYPGVSYRNLIITSLLPVESLPSVICFPPHDITGKNILEYLPNHELIKEIMFTSQNILKENKLNLERKQSNKKEVSMVWLWGPGSLPSMPKFSDLFSLKGANIAAVDLIKGISKSIGFEVIKVTGATGYYDTDYQAKANYALQALEEFDLVYIHIEAPDEASHNGEISEKIKAIEEIDQKVLGTILEKVERYQDYKILLITDHYTPVSLKTHTKEIVPFIVYGTSIEKDDIVLFDEESAKDSSLYFEEGYKLMEWFINK